MPIAEFESFVRAVLAWPVVSCVVGGLMLALPRPRKPCGAVTTILVVVAPQVVGAGLVISYWAWSVVP